MDLAIEDIQESLVNAQRSYGIYVAGRVIDLPRKLQHELTDIIIIIIIIILFISYIIVQQQDVVSKKTPKVQNMVWPTIKLHGRQIHDYVVIITLVHSMTGHSVVTYHNTLSNNASIDVIIRYMFHDTSLVVCHTSTLYN